ncbi:hypothetical protein ACMU_18220 [Actibacterium mucosum KCTC 23349]|uniref:Imelysin-like domain-containing protein n=1 Tax=Actibacterium mucosum KCTC 23349 TaxID=1454373 RepID=A0A037ZD03_9RHOB|nr:imelysin family protein [Actibacterium mucosum]KAJ54364.1 hypothetical protein ACMU_18220 [Actibacterium mucosum KCTC 23349]
MIRAIVLLMSLLLVLPVKAQTGTEISKELGLPYWAPGRGEVDHDALRRRSLNVLERQYSAFVVASEELHDSAIAYCDADAPREDVVTAFRAAWLAWAPLDSYQFGPVEFNGAVLSVNFWPDKKNFTGRALAGLLKQPLQSQRDPATIAAASAAVQGLPAIEMLLFTEAPECPAITGVSGFLAQMAQRLYDDWFGPDGWADLARAAGPDNPVYLSAEEFTKTLYTALDFGLIRISEQRLGRPLGTFDRSFPTRAEAWRSGLSNAIIGAQLDGVAAMIREGFAGDIRDPDRAWVLKVIGQTQTRLDRVALPISDAVADPVSRVRVEVLKQKVDALRLSLAEDIGPGLGVDTGFSPADGD